LITAWASPYTEPEITDNKPRVGLTRLGRLVENISFMGSQKYEKLRMCLASYTWEHSMLDLIGIAAYLNVGSLASRNDSGQPDEIDWKVIYTRGLPKFASVYGAMNTPKAKIIIADGFIEGLFILNALPLNTPNVKDSLAHIKALCDETNLSFKSVITLLATREEIITSMLAANIDVFRHRHRTIANTDPTSFMDAVVRIKHCIYDGFRENLLVDGGDCYITKTGLKVKTPPLYQIKSPDQSPMALLRPKYILTDELDVKLNMKTMVEYNVKCKKVSVMDGFVAVDAKFGEY
jgi:hypothetical protein